MTWRDFYKKVTNPYKAKGIFYTGAGHHGDDFACAPHGSIPSYFTGVLVENGHTPVLGNWSVYRRSDGKYAGFAHLLIGSRRNVGSKVVPGDIIGKAATYGDDHGSAWEGAHCHTTVSPTVHGIYDGNTVDPWPSIKAAITATTKPAPKPVKVKVKKGDTLTKIAARAKTTVPQVMRLNPYIKDPDNIHIGDSIRVK